MRSIYRFSSASALAALLGLGSMTGLGCGTASDQPTDESAQEESEGQKAALAACHLDDGTVEMTASVHACDPQDHKKTTICHVPPGNPANAHTLCIGNPAVAHHLANHPDYLGPCKDEAPCPPPATGTGGAGGGTGGATGTGGACNVGAAGAGGGVPAGVDGGSTGGTGGIVLGTGGTTGNASGGAPGGVLIE
jgi:hypothetical protein